MNGNITSPGHPGNYSAGITCVWHIKVPIKYAVSISFDTFSLEYDKRCLFDSVEFFDGASVNSKSIIRICGKNPPSGIRSSMNYLTIRMQTDGTVESSGFVLRWNYTDPTYPRMYPHLLILTIISRLANANLKPRTLLYVAAKSNGIFDVYGKSIKM